jgi:hypothetical protein
MRAMEPTSSREPAEQLTGAPPNRRHRRFLSESFGFAVTRVVNLRSTENSAMLYTIAIVLVVLWLLGLVTSYTMGGFLHVLLVLAVIMILVQVFQGRRI